MKTENEEVKKLIHFLLNQDEIQFEIEGTYNRFTGQFSVQEIAIGRLKNYYGDGVNYINCNPSV